METSSVSKVGLNDSVVCCYLLAEDDGSAVLHIKLKTILRLFGAKDPSSWQSNTAFSPPIMDKLWFTVSSKGSPGGDFMAIGFV